MSKKRHAPEEIVAELRQVDVLVAQGQTIDAAARSIGVTQTTYHRWRREFGGLELDGVKRLKELEAENQRLRKALRAPERRSRTSGTRRPRARGAPP
jgi:transposase-like protein